MTAHLPGPGHDVSGRVEAIWLKRARRGAMDSVEGADAVAGRGLVGNADQGGRRQVTLLEREAWDAMMAELGGTLDPAIRRANVLLNGVSLAASRGRTLRIGAVRIRIEGETRPCERMEAALEGLREAMRADWNGGAFGTVLDSGRIQRGDAVDWV